MMQRYSYILILITAMNLYAMEMDQQMMNLGHIDQSIRGADVQKEAAEDAGRRPVTSLNTTFAEMLAHGKAADEDRATDFSKELSDLLHEQRSSLGVLVKEFSALLHEQRAKMRELEEAKLQPLELCYDKPSKDFVDHYMENCPQQALKCEIVDVIRAVFSSLQNKENEVSALTKMAMKRKIALVGPPGVGKSMLAKCIARYCNAGYLFKSAPAIPNEYKNSGITKLNDLFSQLFKHKSPVFLILDELSGLTDRHGAQNNPDPGMMEHLLTLLDCCDEFEHIVVIITTNDVESLPEPLKSRLHGAIIKIDDPDFEHRKKIIKFWLGKASHALEEVQIEDIARKCNKLSGREIEQMVRIAAALACKIERDDLLNALHKVREEQPKHALAARDCPDLPGRKQVIKSEIAKFLHQAELLGEKELDSLAKKCENFTRGEIEHMVQHAHADASKIAYADLLGALAKIRASRSLTSSRLKNLKESAIKSIPYIISGTGIILTVAGLCMQWHAHKQQIQFHADQMLQVANQMKQSSTMHIQQMVFNLAMHTKNLQEQMYKEIFQLWLRLRANEKDELSWTLDRYIRDGNNSLQFNQAVAATELATTNAKIFAQSGTQNMIEIIEGAADELVKSGGKDSSILKELLKDPQHIPSIKGVGLFTSTYNWINGLFNRSASR